jgi:hypothetical protein
MSIKHIYQSIFAGDVARAIELSRPCLDGLSIVQTADVAYIEPRMQGDGGHFSRLAACYEHIFFESNLDMCLLHRQGWKDSKRPHWAGVFPVPDHVVGYGNVSSDLQMAGFTQYYEFLFDQCLRHTGASLAVFATARFLTILAAVRTVEKNPVVSGAIFGIMETDRTPDCDDIRLVESAFRAAAELVVNSQKSFLIFAESDSIREYLLRCGFPANGVFVNPYPAAHRFQDPEHKNHSSSSANFGVFGGGREVHNPGLMADFLLNSPHRSLDWTVRLNLELAALRLNMGVSELRRALTKSNINLLETRLEDAAYDRILSSIDVMVFPYGNRYRTIGSGIFLESICAGNVPLLPAQSTMHGLYQKLGGQAPAIEELTTVDLDQAISICIREFKELRENVNCVRRAWLSHEQGPVSWAGRVQDFVLYQ